MVLILISENINCTVNIKGAKPGSNPGPITIVNVLLKYSDIPKEMRAAKVFREGSKAEYIPMYRFTP